MAEDEVVGALGYELGLSLHLPAIELKPPWWVRRGDPFDNLARFETVNLLEFENRLASFLRERIEVDRLVRLGRRQSEHSERKQNDGGRRDARRSRKLARGNSHRVIPFELRRGGVTDRLLIAHRAPDEEDWVLLLRKR